MGNAGIAAARHFQQGALVCLIAATAGAPGCGAKPSAVVKPEPPQALRLEQPAPPPSQNAATEAKPAHSEAESTEAREALTRAGASLEASQAEAAKLRQELKAAQANLRGWHAAYKAVQTQAAGLQKAAAGLKARNDQLQRQEAEAAAALRDAQARLAFQAQPVPQVAPSGVPYPAAVPPDASAAVPAPVASPPLGVVRDLRPFRGRPYATLSVGHDAGVRRGMRVGLADPRTGAPAGVVTVDEVGAAECGGVVEAADPLGLRPGLTVHSIAEVSVAR